jgi:sugar phosphate isomerase/epimerase
MRVTVTLEEESMIYQRISPVRLGGALIALIGLGGTTFMVPVAAADRDKPAKIDVGLQLYSLRAQLPKDLPGTLSRIEQWGVRDVETAGFYDLSARRFREELDKHDLHASGAHFPWERFAEDVDGVLRDAKTLGCEYVTVPWIPHQGEFTAKDALRAVEKFNEWGHRCAESGFHFTYHPHGYEFRPHGGGSLFDLIAQGTKSEVVNFELDIFWAYDGGADPVQLMRKYPNRFPQMHLKDMKKSVKTPNYSGHENVENDVTLGTGQLSLPAILKEAARVGVKHYYIEDESKVSERQIPQSIQYLRSIGF